MRRAIGTVFIFSYSKSLLICLDFQSHYYNEGYSRNASSKLNLVFECILSESRHDLIFPALPKQLACLFFAVISSNDLAFSIA